MTLQRQQKVEVTIESLAFGGAGVAHHEGMAVFVHGAAPGDRLRVQVTRRKKSHAEAAILEVLEPGPDRQEAPCPLVGDCGGCKWQHLPHAVQCEAKGQILRDTLQRLGGLEDVPLEPVTPSPEEFRYRNKMDLTFGRAESGEVTLGFHRAGRFDQIIDVAACLLQPEPFDAVLQVFRDHANTHGLAPYDPRDHTGSLRSVILRDGRNTGEAMVILLTAETHLPDREGLVERLRAACPSLTSFVWGQNTGKSDVAVLERVLWEWGEPCIHERLSGLTYEIAPMAFFQVNTPATERLYARVVEALDLTGEESVLDAFCGTGTIGLTCAPHARHIYGLELHLPAVQGARENARRNGLDNCTFLAGDVRETLPLVTQIAQRALSRVIVDPPRGGMHRKALASLIDLRAPLFVYVSCNPTTLARDLIDLRAGGYGVERIWPHDLFPQTHHIECVVKLRRRPA